MKYFFEKCFADMKFTIYLHSEIKTANLFYFNGTLAQLVEQRTENPCVPGSIPGGTTTKNHDFNRGFLVLYFIPFFFPILFRYIKVIV